MGLLDFILGGTRTDPVVLPIVQPRAAATPEEEAAFQSFGFDPSEKQMPAVIDEWVKDYRLMRAGLIDILPSVDSNNQAAATGNAAQASSNPTTLETLQAVAIGKSNPVITGLADVASSIVKGKDRIIDALPSLPPIKKILIGVAIGVGVIVIIFGIRSTTKLVEAVKG